MTWKQLFTTVPICLLAASVAFAQQEQRERQQRERADQPAGPSEQQVELPQFLDELDLTSQQEQSIKQALREHNQKLMETWREFHTRHARAIELEAAWAVAVRDTLSEQDQRRFDQQQMQDREMTRQEGATQRRNSPPPRDEARQDRASDSPPARETRRQRREQRERDDAQRDRSDAQTRTDDQPQQDTDEREGFSVVVFTITSPESYTQGTNQTDEQKQQCSEACRKFKQELTSAWQDVRRLHVELVQIEADRIEAIEEELTEEQLAQLKEQRQSPPEETASDEPTQRRSR